MGMECTLPDYSQIPLEAKEIVQNTQTIALVGASPKPERPSYQVMNYLLQEGFKVIPVNLAQSYILEQKCYPSLVNIPQEIDIDTVIIFRHPDYVLDIVKEAILRKVKYIWLQERIIQEEALNLAKSKGIKGVMNFCFKKVHLLLKTNSL